MRSAIAATILLCLARDVRRRPKSARPFLVAVAFAATMLLFVLSSRATTAANAVFLQSTAPLYVLVLGPLLLRERLERRDLVPLIGMGLGLALLLAAPMEPGEARATAPDPALGNALAAVGGATWALSILGLRWISNERTATLFVVAVGNAVVFLCTLPFAWPIAFGGTADLLVMLWLGVFQIGLAYLCVSRGIGGVSAFEASLLFLVEPVLNPVWAWLVHGEVPGDLALFGGVLILACAVHVAFARRRPPEAPLPVRLRG